MMKVKNRIAAALAAYGASALLFSAPLPAQAQDPTPTAPARRSIAADSKLVIGGNFTLESGEVIEGDLAVIGGDVTLKEGSVVEGDVVVIGGTLDAAGVIQGDLGQLGGNITMRESLRVDGSIDSVGGNQTRSRAAPAPVGVPEPPPAPEDHAPEATAIPRAGNLREAIRRAIRENSDRILGDGDERFRIRINNGTRERVIPGALIITLLAMIAAALAPRNLNVAAQTLREQPWLSFGMGVLTLIGGVIVLGLSLILIVTVCISPLIGIAAIIAGWTVTSMIAGAYIARQINRTGWAPLLQLAVGSLALALIGAIPIVGDVLGPLFVALGLGALVLTRGGTRYYEPQFAAANRPSQIPPASYDI